MLNVNDRNKFMKSQIHKQKKNQNDKKHINCSNYNWKVKCSNNYDVTEK